MRSSIAETDRSDNTIKITALSREPGNPRLTDIPSILKNIYGKFMTNMDQNQSQLINTTTNLEHFRKAT